MSRCLVWAAVPWLIVAGEAGAQEKPEEKKSPAVVELLEDGTAFHIENLNNNGGEDGSVAERSEEAPFSGDSSLSVTTFQRFAMQMPGWNYQIAENPEPGQFRYLRFAWKRTEAPGIMLQIFARPKFWHRYYAGTVTKEVQGWGPMTRVVDSAPRQWELVTRDLYKDFGAMTITGIGFSALEGPGHAGYDHIYLGRTIEDLDRVTAARKNADVAPDAVPARRPRLFWAVLTLVVISLAGFVGLALFLRLRKPKGERQGDQRVRKPAGKEAGKKGSKPHPESTEA